MKKETIEFNIINDLNTNVVVNLFDINASPIPEKPHGKNSFYISSVGSYNQWVKDMPIVPKEIVKVTLFSDSIEQMFREWNIVFSDANGQKVKIPEYPNIAFSAYQFQQGMTEIHFVNGELILNGSNVISQYIVKRNTSLKMLIDYYQ